jgi:hypothetical protein
MSGSHMSGSHMFGSHMSESLFQPLTKTGKAQDAVVHSGGDVGHNQREGGAECVPAGHITGPMQALRHSCQNHTYVLTKGNTCCNRSRYPRSVQGTVYSLPSTRCSATIAPRPNTSYHCSPQCLEGCCPPRLVYMRDEYLRNIKAYLSRYLSRISFYTDSFLSPQCLHGCCPPGLGLPGHMRGQ